MKPPKEIPGYVERNLEYYLKKEGEGDEEASRKVYEICMRWGI